MEFGSAEELFAALRTPDALARRRVLGWVATNPEKAIALGGAGGEDVVDAMLGLINRDWSYPHWQDIAIAVGAFDSPKVTAFLLDLLATADESGQAFDAATGLERRRDREGVRERVAEILMGEGPPERLAAAAQVLAPEEDLPENVAIRAALFEDTDPAPISEANADAWSRELDGPAAEQARERLGGQGAAAINLLASRWGRLGPETRAWLVAWAAEEAPDADLTAGLVDIALGDEAEEVALAALEAGQRLSRAPSGQRLARWAEHPEPEVRAIAVAAGASVDLDAIVGAGTEPPEVLAAAIERLREARGEEAAGAIARHLESDSHEVRSAARDELVAIGQPAIEWLRPYVHSSAPETRATAVRALLDLGDDDWLAQELLDEPRPQ